MCWLHYSLTFTRNLVKEGCRLVVFCGAMPSLWALCGLGLHKMSHHMSRPPTYNCPHAMSLADRPHTLSCAWANRPHQCVTELSLEVCLSPQHKPMRSEHQSNAIWQNGSVCCKTSSSGAQSTHTFKQKLSDNCTY